MYYLYVVVSNSGSWAFAGRLDFLPHFKPTSLGAPLSHFSGHPWHVHKGWTLAECVRLAHTIYAMMHLKNAEHVPTQRLVAHTWRLNILGTLMPLALSHARVMMRPILNPKVCVI